MRLLPCLVVAILWAQPALADEAANQYFRIQVVDEQTGRGVPLVELKTTNALRYYTDSNGLVAFHEPGLMGQKVFFFVKSHGYEFTRDGFGMAGRALDVQPGGGVTLKIRRVNVAERLYRVTGGGIYADSVLLGEEVPLKQPVLNAQVLGQDSVLNAVYRGKLFWFWGDTNKPSYPLGNFHAPAATSKLPKDGGLDPNVGVELTYFVDDKGFAKPTAKMPGPGPTWLGGVTVLRDKKGGERMFAAYARIKGRLEVYERGLVEWDDASEEFRKVTEFPLDGPALPGGHPFLHTEGKTDYVYFPDPYPLVRVEATPDALRDPSRYEAFTCLAEGTRPDQKKPDRGPDGQLRYGWKKNTSPLTVAEQAKWLKEGVLRPHEALLQLRDVDTGKAVQAHGGSVYWNDYRKRWVLVAVELLGTSVLGEVWYAEADTPLGPWAYARKVVTHEKYSFYNPRQHPYFDQDGGRRIYFEGTYTHTFSGNPDQTPRYDYNQVMYRLDLDDPRLRLPVPVYRLTDKDGTVRYKLRDSGLTPKTDDIAFFAPDRAAPGTVPVYATDQGLTLKVKEVGDVPLFYALPADRKNAPASTVPLSQYAHADGRRGETPLCRVWANPYAK